MKGRQSKEFFYSAIQALHLQQDSNLHVRQLADKMITHFCVYRSISFYDTFQKISGVTSDMRNGAPSSGGFAPLPPPEAEDPCPLNGDEVSHLYDILTILNFFSKNFY